MICAYAEVKSIVQFEHSMLKKMKREPITSVLAFILISLLITFSLDKDKEWINLHDFACCDCTNCWVKFSFILIFISCWQKSWFFNILFSFSTVYLIVVYKFWQFHSIIIVKKIVKQKNPLIIPANSYCGTFDHSGDIRLKIFLKMLLCIFTFCFIKFKFDSKMKHINNTWNIPKSVQSPSLCAVLQNIST